MIRFTLHAHKTDGNPADCPEEWPDLVLQEGQEAPPGAVVMEMSEEEFEAYKDKHRPAYEAWEAAHFLAQRKERLLPKLRASGVLLLATGAPVEAVGMRYNAISAQIEQAATMDELERIAASI
jgi:hypothetical protein